MAKVSTIIIAFILGITIMMLAVGFYGGVMTAYNMTANTSFMKVYEDTWGSMIGLSSSMQNQTQASQIDEANIFTTMSSGAYKALKMALSLPSLVNAMLVDLANRYGLPPYLPQVIIVILSIIIIFIIISAIFKYAL